MGSQAPAICPLVASFRLACGSTGGLLFLCDRRPSAAPSRTTRACRAIIASRLDGRGDALQTTAPTTAPAAAAPPADHGQPSARLPACLPARWCLPLPAPGAKRRREKAREGLGLRKTARSLRRPVSGFGCMICKRPAGQSSLCREGGTKGQARERGGKGAEPSKGGPARAASARRDFPRANNRGRPRGEQEKKRWKGSDSILERQPVVQGLERGEGKGGGGDVRRAASRAANTV